MQALFLLFVLDISKIYCISGRLASHLYIKNKEEREPTLPETDYPIYTKVWSYAEDTNHCSLSYELRSDLL